MGTPNFTFEISKRRTRRGEGSVGARCRSLEGAVQMSELAGFHYGGEVRFCFTGPHGQPEGSWGKIEESEGTVRLSPLLAWRVCVDGGEGVVEGFAGGGAGQYAFENCSCSFPGKRRGFGPIGLELLFQ